MSKPTRMAGNVTSWVAAHVINNLDGENLNGRCCCSVRYRCVTPASAAETETIRHG